MDKSLIFGEPKEIGSLIITWETAFASDYSMFVSNDDQNTPAYSMTLPVPNRVRRLLSSNQTCRYLKLTMDSAGAGYLFEFMRWKSGMPVLSSRTQTYLSGKTVEGIAPELPEKVTATYSDGKQSDLKVT